MTECEMFQRLWDFVVRDPRFNTVGVRGGARELLIEANGTVPDEEELTRIVAAFWLARDEGWAKPRRATIGGGSPFYQRKGELSPGQENAIRDLEDRRDV